MAWHNGVIVPYDSLALHVSELAVVAGASLTEMARTFAHKPFRLRDHVKRLQESCDELGFDLPFHAAELVAAGEHIVAANSEALDDSDDLGIVMFVTAGTNRTYFGAGPLPPPNVILHTFRLPRELWKPAAESGVRLVVPQRRQLPDDSFPVHRKVRNRLHWWLADREVDAANPGCRALLLDREGHVTETSNGCFFAVVNDTIVTPARGVLDSMSRRIVAEAAADMGMSFERAPICRDDFSSMSAAFVTSTPFGVLPVAAIDEFEFDSHNVARQLAGFWEKLTGVNPLQQLLA